MPWEIVSLRRCIYLHLYFRYYDPIYMTEIFGYAVRVHSPAHRIRNFIARGKHMFGFVNFMWTHNISKYFVNNLYNVVLNVTFRPTRTSYKAIRIQIQNRSSNSSGRRLTSIRCLSRGGDCVYGYWNTDRCCRCTCRSTCRQAAIF